MRKETCMKIVDVEGVGPHDVGVETVPLERVGLGVEIVNLPLTEYASRIAGRV